MSQNLIAWLLSFATAIAKQAAAKSAPIALGIVRDLSQTAFELVEAELDSSLSTEEKSIVKDAAIGVAKTAWAVAEQEGVLLASDSLSLIAQAAGAQIQEALGLQ